jgi:segregation and condensation protein B
MDIQIKKRQIAALEALLFVHGEPLTLSKIETALNVGEEEARATIEALNEELAGEHRGIWLISDGRKVQLTTKPAFSNLLEDFAKEQLSEELTPAVLEVLAVISYCAPITKTDIEHIRGVNSTVTLRNLLLRGFIEKVATEKEHVAYQPTFDLLKHLGVEKMEDLPDYEKFKDLYRGTIESTETGELAGVLAAEPEAG